MARVLDEDDARVEVATDEEVQRAIGRGLKRVGLTYDELRHQASEDEFSSERARRLWFMISPVDE